MRWDHTDPNRTRSRSEGWLCAEANSLDQSLTRSPKTALCASKWSGYFPWEPQRRVGESEDSDGVRGTPYEPCSERDSVQRAYAARWRKSPFK